MTDLRFEHKGKEILLAAERTPERTPEGWRVRLPNQSVYEIASTSAGNLDAEITIAPLGTDGAHGPERRISTPSARLGPSLVLSWRGRSFAFQPLAREGTKASTPGRSGSVTAPNGGVIADVLVAEGQKVEAYEQIAIIEAMKVMTPVEAPCAGVVERLFISKGMRIEQGAAIAQIAPSAGTNEAAAK